MARVHHPDGADSVFQYNGDGQRIKSYPKTGSPLTYLWSGGEVLKEYPDDPAVPPTSYFYGVGQILHERGGATRFSHTDGLGSVIALTDEAGTVTDAYDYDVWGAILPPQPGDPPNQSYNTKKFTGQINDDDTGLLYLRARYYDPKLRRFISKDPIGFEGGINLYQYCGNNPVNSVDPSGLISDDEMIAANPSMDVMARQAENAKYLSADPLNYNGTQKSKDIFDWQESNQELNRLEAKLHEKDTRNRLWKAFSKDMGACVELANETLRVIRDLNLKYWHGEIVRLEPITDEGTSIESSLHTSVGFSRPGEQWGEEYGYLVDVERSFIGLGIFTPALKGKTLTFPYLKFKKTDSTRISTDNILKYEKRH